MSAKKWIVLFLGAALAAVLVCGIFNMAVDPFGVFGDKLLHWESYSMTNNPHVAKIRYLEDHPGEYDSFVVGSSSAAPYDPQELNGYTGGRFYNLFAYGAGIKESLLDVRYLVERQQPKNIILNLEITAAGYYDSPQESLNDAYHPLVSGESSLLFYLRYAFCNPKYSFEKLSSRSKDTELPQAFDVFLPETGCYDKRVRDVEPIDSLEEYLALHGSSFPAETAAAGFGHLDEYEAALREIRELCESRGVTLTVVFSPDYHTRIEACDPAGLLEMKRRTARVVDYWDFSNTSISYDSRYFYDTGHFRNAVCTMMLARMYGDDTVYVPEGFGDYVTAETVEDFAAGYFSAGPAPEESYSVEVPVLLYHSLAEYSEKNDLTPARLDSHLTVLENAGYTTISFEELHAYVEQGAPLPPRPILITFDDGYLSNYELAYPVLKKHNAKATIFAIGVSVGKTTYKDTGKPMTPHFTLEQAAEMEASGLISVQTHGYNFHEVTGYDEEPIRSGVQQREDEDEEAYLAFLRQDFAVMEQLLGRAPTVLAYPYGLSSTESEVISREAGIKTTLTTVQGVGTVIKGLPQSLRKLDRLTVASNTAEELMSRLTKKQ